MLLFDGAKTVSELASLEFETAQHSYQTKTSNHYPDLFAVEFPSLIRRLNGISVHIICDDQACEEMFESLSEVSRFLNDSQVNKLVGISQLHVFRERI